MSAPFVLFSEKYRPEGGAGGDAARRALGRPKLDRLSVLVREAVQNSWDARKSETAATVDFIARLGSFSQVQLRTIRDRVFAQLPPHHPLKDSLKSGLAWLIMEDRGTKGLGGPVFKERVSDPSEPRQFIRFFRDIGRAAGEAKGGGTYGYGKSVFFNASAASTIVVYTRFEKAGKFTERLMAMSLSSASEDEVFTGRHWWGVEHGESVGPLSGNGAGLLATELGFERYDGDATGTAIMILAPDLSDNSTESRGATAERLAESMMFWYWPRMLGGMDNAGRIKFRAFADGAEVAVPDPASTPPFNIYCAAFTALQNAKLGSLPGPPHRVVEIRSERPAARLGWLSLSLAPRQARKIWTAAIANPAHPLREQLDGSDGKIPFSHHVALFRAPGQVIRYLSASSYPVSAMEYAGIFFLEAETEEITQEFIEAEPPSHDDWIDPERGSNKRSVVRIAKRRIRTECEDFAAAGRPIIEGDSQDALGSVSAELGQLLSAPGTGAGGGEIVGKKGGRPPRRSAGRRLKVRMLDSGRLEERKGIRVFVVRFDVEGQVSEKGATIVATARVVLAGGGAETDAPVSSSMPKVLSWEKKSAPARSHQGANLTVMPDDVGEWETTISLPTDAMISVSIAPDQ